MKKTTLVNIVGIINMQQKMFGACFEGYIVRIYGFEMFIEVGSNISIDLVNIIGYFTIILIIGSNFVFTFSFDLNVGSFSKTSLRYEIGNLY
jgi:hypothetical protein